VTPPEGLDRPRSSLLRGRSIVLGPWRRRTSVRPTSEGRTLVSAGAGYLFGMPSSNRTQRKRRRERHVLNRKLTIGLLVSITAAVVGIAGMLLTDGGVFADRAMYFFFALAAIGAVSAMIQMIIRSKRGSDIDEAKL
jgi:hypothetical protein